ncbi:MAG: hypothetical protein KatS3mg057_2321 [Herpetosiphonaceae bacterium]|nr:MAG: hypothetical protein KatS3mg057_2321 [Herpetosiphonaceae bacterium]
MGGAQAPSSRGTTGGGESGGLSPQSSYQEFNVSSGQEQAEAAPGDHDAGSPPLAATPIAQTTGFSDDPNRKIIKNADLTIAVESVEIGMSRVSSIAAQMGGYLLDSRTDFSNSYAKSSIIQIAVPVEKFEMALELIRQTGEVRSEQASGTDVTQEYVDIQSQIANLEATQARVREFLDQARTVEEALKVNAQLTQLEGQISQLKGRLQFLSQRAAYSIITVNFQQVPPAATPTPTPAPVAWDPGDTAQDAFGALKVILQAFATGVIWLVIFVLPLLLPLLLIWLSIRVFRRRIGQTQTPQTPRPNDAAAGKTG